MVLLSIILMFTFFVQTLGTSKEIIVEYPFYLRARMHDSHTANVLFQIARKSGQRTCQMYKFTIRRNHQEPYSMPEQNLTFWRNSLELQHLDAGHYRVCAIICSEQLLGSQHHDAEYEKKNRTKPTTACVYFHASRTHGLILTLYILVFLFLVILHIIYSLRKRQFQARVKKALFEFENYLQKRHTTQASSISTDPIESIGILRSFVTLPASLAEYSQRPVSQSDDVDDDDDSERRSAIFHSGSENKRQFSL